MKAPALNAIPLRELVSEARGGFASGARDPAGIVQLRMNNVTSDGSLDWSSLTRVPADRSGIEAYKLQPGDVLFNATNSAALVGKTALFVGYPEPVVFSNHFTRVRSLRNRLLPEYLAFWLQAQWRLRVFERICDRWIGQAAVQRDKLLDLAIPCPSLAEQRRITARLSEQLAAVEGARKAALARAEAAEFLISAYLQAEFEGCSRHGWPLKKIADFAETGSGITPSRTRPDYFGGTIPWVKTAELRDGLVWAAEERITASAVQETGIEVLPERTVLVAMYGQGQTRGRTGILGTAAATNQACFAIRPNDGVFEPRYLQYWLRSRYGSLRSATEGRGGNQPNLNGEILRDLDVPLPPVPVQREAVSRLDELERVAGAGIAAAEAELAAISALPAALLREAFNSAA